SSTLQNPKVSPSITSIYSLTVSTNVSGCNPATVYTTTVTVNPLPTPPTITTAPPSPICLNTIQRFGTSKPPAGISYNWTASTNALVIKQDTPNNYQDCLT